MQLLPAYLPLAVKPLDSNGTQSVVLWSMVLIGLLLFAFGGYSLFKKWMNQSDETTRGPGFTLSDLRLLRDQGKMTSEEYELARAKMVAAAKKMTEKMPEIVPRRARTGNSKNETLPSTEIRMTNDETRPG
jgi:hypothetical protein